MYICDNRFMVFRARREDDGNECTYINGKQVDHTVNEVWDMIIQKKRNTNDDQQQIRFSEFLDPQWMQANIDINEKDNNPNNINQNKCVCFY